MTIFFICIFYFYTLFLLSVIKFLDVEVKKTKKNNNPKTLILPQTLRPRFQLKILLKVENILRHSSAIRFSALRQISMLTFKNMFVLPVINPNTFMLW